MTAGPRSFRRPLQERQPAVARLVEQGGELAGALHGGDADALLAGDTLAGAVGNVVTLTAFLRSAHRPLLPVVPPPEVVQPLGPRLVAAGAGGAWYTDTGPTSPR